MGYYIRVLAKSDEQVSLDALEKRLERDGIPARIEVGEKNERGWSRIVVLHTDPKAPSERIIAVLEGNPVIRGELGESELEEFSEEIRDAKPAAAVRWLQEYFALVKVNYSIKIIHSGVEWGRGWDAIHALQGEIWSIVGGISQADYEGFSNEEGYHILGQFNEDVTGPWNMAVLKDDNEWIAFEMDLGNLDHREPFMAGAVPKGVKITERILKES